jgi:hypothetical protein
LYISTGTFGLGAIAVFWHTLVSIKDEDIIYIKYRIQENTLSKTLFIILTMAIIFVTGASASNVIIFDNQSAHPGGTLTFGTSSGAASLADGVIDEVTGIDGAVTSFSVAGTCGTGSYGCLNFTTGLFLGSSNTGDSN